MQIKTITTVAGVNEIDFGNDDSQTTAHFYWFKNLSNSTLYVSAVSNPVAGEDNVAELSAKGAASVETDEGKVYVLGAGKVEIHRTNSKFCPFELPSTGSGGGGGGSITVDSELSETSENPLQNKAITAAINEVKSELDTKSDVNHIHDITASGNPATLTNLQGEVPFSEIVVSGKNLLPSDYITKSGTLNGITVNVKNDGRFDVSGTATKNFMAILFTPEKFQMIGGEKYTFNCSQPYNINTFNIFVRVYNKDGVQINGISSYPTTITANDGDYFLWGLWAVKNYEMSATDVEVQLELGSTPTEYEPPITSQEVTITRCGKNILTPMTESIEYNGVTYTVNSDGTVTLNGTCSVASGVDIVYKKPIKAGTYTLSGCPVGGSPSTFALRIGLGESNTLYGRDYGDGFTFTLDEDNIITITIQNAVVGVVFDDVVYKPQLELGDTATEYEPYHADTISITPASNPYTIQNDLLQYDNINTLIASIGELEVVGVQKNAATKRIWDEIGDVKAILATVTGGIE